MMAYLGLTSNRGDKAVRSHAKQVIGLRLQRSWWGDLGRMNGSHNRDAVRWSGVTLPFSWIMERDRFIGKKAREFVAASPTWIPTCASTALC
jgi:hypothetical protein